MAESLRSSLPSPNRDGKWYVDVKVRNAWDGILVIDESFHCVGIYVYQSIKQMPLPFSPEEIQDLRAPCLTNRMLARLPFWFNIWLFSLAGILIVGPSIFFLAVATTPYLSLLTAPVVILSWMGMYSSPGFPLIRFPVAVIGLVLVIQSVLLVAQRVWSG